MLLAIDIGNTNTVIGGFSDDVLLGSFRIQSSRAYTTDEAGMLCKQLIDHHIPTSERVQAVVLCSVVPALTAVYENMARLYLECELLTLTADFDLGFPISVSDPRQVGTDRLANAMAAGALYGTPAVVVDFGTATTFDVLDGGGAYIGGVIAPGVITSASELAQRAAQLFRVRIEEPQSLIGADTAAAMRSGIYYGTVGQVERILGGITRELGSQPQVVATGGLADLWHRGIDAIDHVDIHLTLKGLRLFWERCGKSA